MLLLMLLAASRARRIKFVGDNRVTVKLLGE
jgi:hypothetical protein